MPAVSLTLGLAGPLNKRALATREKTLGPGHHDVAQSLNNLASFYGRRGRYADAEPLFTRLTTSTFDIMKADSKLGRAAALRNAMLTHMNDRESSLSAYPAFWGPFSIIGESGAR